MSAKNLKKYGPDSIFCFPCLFNLVQRPAFGNFDVVNEDLLKLCREKIEARLSWAGSDLWTHQDFELLSERILAETKVRLSPSTLKRVWGKVNHQGGISISTLNVLATFAGFTNWSEFKNCCSRNSPEISARPMRQSRGWSLFRVTFAVSAVVIIAVVVLFAFKKEDKPVIDLSQIEFGSRPTSIGLPNSVVFTYDFGDNTVEEAKIQQSWDDRLTFKIEPKGKEATGIYYYPGYFRAKLLADNQIVKEHDLHLKTVGWLATVDVGPKPRYLLKDEFVQHDVLRVSDNVIQEYVDARSPEAPRTSFHYFDSLGNVSGSDFEFEMKFRNAYSFSNGICRKVSILVHGTETVFITPFSMPGCVSNLKLWVSGKSVDGKSNDLSSFAANLQEWQHFRLTVKDKKAYYYLNEKLIREEVFEKQPGRVIGFRFRFEGWGEVDDVRLSRGGSDSPVFLR